ncbi:hypothetical protein MPER_04503, partial [Moniliophthora perniciosa FA553]
MPIVDGATSFCRDFYLKNKDADTVLWVLETYRAWAEQRTGKKLRSIRIDNGREFVNEKVEEWARKHGIELEVIAPYSSADNGVAERKHLSTFARVRTVLYESQLPPFLWAHAASYIVYSDNMLPSARHPGVIPAEAFLQKRQSVHHLRPFGSFGWAKINDGSVGKLDSRVVEGRLVGYGERGTYVLYTSTGSLIVSRDVVWDEKRVPRRVPAGGEQYWDIGEYEFLPAGNDDMDRPNSDDVTDPDPLTEIPEAQEHSTSQIHTSTTVVELLPPRRSSRIPKPSNSSIQSKESESREKVAKESCEEWATNSKRPRAKFAQLPDHFSELDYTFNAALIAFGLPPLPKGFRKAMEDQERWLPAVEKEKLRMKEFRVFGEANTSRKCTILVGYGFALSGGTEPVRKG